MTRLRKAVLILFGLATLCAVCAWLGLYLGYETMPSPAVEPYLFKGPGVVGLLSAVLGLATLVVGIVAAFRHRRRGIADVALGVVALAIGLSGAAAGLWMALMYAVGHST